MPGEGPGPGGEEVAFKPCFFVGNRSDVIPCWRASNLGVRGARQQVGLMRGQGEVAPGLQPAEVLWAACHRRQVSGFLL